MKLNHSLVIFFYKDLYDIFSKILTGLQKLFKVTLKKLDMLNNGIINKKTIILAKYVQYDLNTGTILHQLSPSHI